MTAYRNDFLVVDDGSDGDGEGDGSSGFFGYYEPAMIDHEVLTDAEGDIVMMEVDYEFT